MSLDFLSPELSIILVAANFVLLRYPDQKHFKHGVSGHLLLQASFGALCVLHLPSNIACSQTFRGFAFPLLFWRSQS